MAIFVVTTTAKSGVLYKLSTGQCGTFQGHAIQKILKKIVILHHLKEKNRPDPGFLEFSDKNSIHLNS